MKTHFAIFALAFGLLVSSHAQVPYQGRLTDVNGTPLPDGNVEIAFSLFTAVSGGTAQWGPKSYTVSLVSGRFSTKLGPQDSSARDIGNALSGGATYLEMTVESDPALVRQEILPAPIALTANGLPNVTILNGKVGIGTTNPTMAPLQVMGVQATSLTTYRNYGRTGNTLYDGPFVKQLSIYAEHEIRALAFLADSDERIKTVKGRSDAITDLETLAQIEITDYTLKDVVGEGSDSYKKVIAQQVEAVFPQAVSQGSGVVPDIYKVAPTAGGWVDLATDLKVGDRVRLIAETKSGVHEVLEVRTGAFRTAFESDVDEVFVFGREVDDFRSVDYEAIAMLNISATQELHRQLEAKEQTIADLQKRLANLETTTAAKLASIEKLLQSDRQLVSVSLSQ